MSLLENDLNPASASDLTQQSELDERNELDEQIDAEYEMERAALRRAASIRTHRVVTFLSIAGCAAVFWLLAVQSARIERLNQHNVQLVSQIQKIGTENTSLQMKLDSLRQPSRLIAIANQLHLTYKPITQIHTSH